MTLTQIERYCKTPISGIHRVQLYLPEHVSVLPDPLLGVYSVQEPVLNEVGTAYHLPFDRFSCSLNSNPESNQAGDYWTHTIRGTLRRNRTDVGLWMHLMKNRYFHLLTEDWYGERMWFPFMRLQSARQVEERLSGRNAFTFTFSRQWNHPGVYLTRNNAPPIDPEVWGDPDNDEIWGDDDFWGWNP